MKKALIAIGIAALLTLGFVAMPTDQAVALGSSSADCNGDGIDDVFCGGGSQCTSTDNVGCVCSSGGVLVDVQSCSQNSDGYQFEDPGES